MDRPYDRVLRCQGNELRVIVDNDTCIAHYNGHHVAEKTGDVGVLVFEVRENGLPVTSTSLRCARDASGSSWAAMAG